MALADEMLLAVVIGPSQGRGGLGLDTKHTAHDVLAPQLALPDIRATRIEHPQLCTVAVKLDCTARPLTQATRTCLLLCRHEIELLALLPQLALSLSVERSADSLINAPRASLGLPHQEHRRRREYVQSRWPSKRATQVQEHVHITTVIENKSRLH